MKGIRKSFVGGNWKCNNMIEDSKALINNIYNKLQYNHQKTGNPALLDVIASPVSIHIPILKQLIKNNVKIAAQNSSLTGIGAFTGEISPHHLKDMGIQWTIIGHSERRSYYGQTDQLVGKKVKFNVDQGLNVIACFGQQLKCTHKQLERQENKTFNIIESQLNAIKQKLQIKNWENIVLAYEPVWAIGTGKVATSDQVDQMHNFIRNYLKSKVDQKVADIVRIIYGGSVNQKNCKQLFKIPNVDGFLVGGASLKPSFAQIVSACSI